MNLAVGRVNLGEGREKICNFLEFVVVDGGNDWQESYKQTEQPGDDQNLQSPTMKA